MGPYEQTIHLLNFIAPAWGLALFCALVARLMPRAWIPLATWGLIQQILVNGLLGVVVLCIGPYVWNLDGKMATYAALVLTCSTTQWLMCRGWRRG